MTREHRMLSERYGEGTPEFCGALLRLEAGEPLAYILGEWGFYGLMFDVTPDVLVPRPATEHIVDTALAILGTKKGHIADLCCGSGCIGISILANTIGVRCLSVDISPAALEVTKANAIRCGVEERLETLLGDVKSPAFYRTLAKYSPAVIVANPPYIASKIIPTLSREVQMEPLIALDGGEDGLAFYRAIIGGVSIMTVRADLVLEIGYDQADSVLALANNYGFSCEIKQDYGKNDRVAVLRSLK